MKRAAVIVGAGASYDVHWDREDPHLRNEFRPPLANELFDARFWPQRSSYNGAAALGAELGMLAKNGALALEEKLTEYANSADSRTRRLFRDIPPYLRDVLNDASYRYSALPSNYITLARRLLADGTHEIVFISLNYDTLLERALKMFDPTLAISSIDDYVHSDRQASVVKIHGSTDWGVPMPGSERIGEWPQAIEGFDPLSAQDERDIVLYDTRDSTVSWRWRETNELLYPRLTAPMTDKEFVCPESHTDFLRSFLPNCHKYLVIGTSGLDNDLLDFMSKLVPDDPCVVNYVNKNGTVTAEVRKNFETRIVGFEKASIFKFSVNYAGGFTAFLRGQNIESFLAAD